MKECTNLTYGQMFHVDAIVLYICVHMSDVCTCITLDQVNRMFILNMFPFNRTGPHGHPSCCTSNTNCNQLPLSKTATKFSPMGPVLRD